MKSRQTIITTIFLFLVVSIYGCAAGLNMTPYLYFNSDTINFGNTALNSTRIFDFVIENHDSEVLKLFNFEIINYSSNAQEDEYEIVEILDSENNVIEDIDKVKVENFSSITVRISFEPTVKETIEATLAFEHNDGKHDSPIHISMTGIGVDNVLKFDPEIVDFGNTILGSTKTIDFQITNLAINEIHLVHFDLNPSVSVFVIESATNSQYEDLPLTSPITILPRDYVNLKISFEPVIEEDSNTELIISYTDNDVLSQAKTTIMGTGIVNKPPVIEYIDLDPVHIGDKAIVKAKVTDPNGSNDIVNVISSLQLYAPTIITMNDSGLYDDEMADDDIYTGSTMIPNSYTLFGNHVLTVTAFDKSNDSTSMSDFQLIYTRDLIEVGQGKPYTAIKPAVNASVDGDCVLIYDGEYSSNNNTIEENRDVDLNGKRIIITSKNGAEKTIMLVDGAAGVFHRAFMCTNGETLNTIINGLTLRGGFMRHEYGGGAIVCVDSDLTLLNCIFYKNVGTCDSSGYAYGGAIGAINADLVVRKCSFIDNNALV